MSAHAWQRLSPQARRRIVVESCDRVDPLSGAGIRPRFDFPNQTTPVGRLSIHRLPASPAGASSVNLTPLASRAGRTE
jgi:hypothetical protein